MSYKLLKNAGILPPEMQLNKEIVRLEQLIRLCKDDSEHPDLQRQLSEKRLQFRLMLERRGIADSSAYQMYGKKLEDKLVGDES